MRYRLLASCAGAVRKGAAQYDIASVPCQLLVTTSNMDETMTAVCACDANAASGLNTHPKHCFCRSRSQ